MSLKLQEGEQILFEGKPEKNIFVMWIFTKIIPMCIAACFYTFFTFMFLFVFFVVAPSCKKNMPFPYHLWSIVLILAPVWFIFFLSYYRNLKKTFHYYVTDQRCVFEGGIIVRRIRSVPYHKITDVEINQNIIERSLGICSLKIFTPGTGSVGMPGFEKAEIIFYGLKDADTPSRIIQEIIKKYRATGE